METESSRGEPFISSLIYTNSLSSNHRLIIVHALYQKKKKEHVFSRNKGTLSSQKPDSSPKTHHLTKSSLSQVTKDPESTSNPKIEKPGTITSDSLAAESLRDGGSFGLGSHAAASQQPSASTNTNNTDTSGATTLPAAPDAEARQALEDWNEDAQFNAARGVQGNNSGSGPAATSSYLATSTGSAPPHGKNITEGGFDANAPNASFNNDIGGKNDPGRQALKDMQKSALQAVGDVGGATKQKNVTDDGQFDVLGDTSA
jgi:hypothetical protein